MPRATESTFVVERMWKGEPTKTVRVLTCGGTIGNEGYACAESFNFQVGSRYVVFAGGQPLATSACARTASIVDADTTLKWLAAKPSRTDFDHEKK